MRAKPQSEKVLDDDQPRAPEVRVALASGGESITKKVHGVVVSELQRKDHLFNPSPKLETLSRERFYVEAVCHSSLWRERYPSRHWSEGRHWEDVRCQ